jgi:hypothetical protein
MAAATLAASPLLGPMLAMGAGAIYLLALVLMQPTGPDRRQRVRKVATAGGAAALAIALAVLIPLTMPH